MLESGIPERCSGSINRISLGHMFQKDVTGSFENLLETGEWIDIKKEYQFFPTPNEIVEKMLDLVKIEAGMKVLEPSAGEGSIVKSLPSKNLKVTCIELNPDSFKNLKKEITSQKSTNTFTFKEGDFLNLKVSSDFDLILMNPPFSKNQDIKHAMKAMSHLKSGGTLVSILSSGAMQNSRKINEEFKEMLDKNSFEIIELEQRSFKSSGTMVNTVMVKIVKL